jgi:hypothetical protein
MPLSEFIRRAPLHVDVARQMCVELARSNADKAESAVLLPALAPINM